jgi:hypothetical protein
MPILAAECNCTTLPFLMRRHAWRSTGRIVREATAAKTIEVASTSLDDFIAHGNTPPSVIKMDIEGGEQWAFNGMVRVLAEARPRMVVEIHNADAFDVLADMARRLDYELQTIDERPLGSSFTARQHVLLVPH